jgi:hypothetical protein
MIRARLELPDLMPAEHLLLADPVAEAGMHHRTQDRDAIGNCRLLGEQLAEAQARRLGGDRLKRSAVLQRRIGLGVPRF